MSSGQFQNLDVSGNLTVKGQSKLGGPGSAITFLGGDEGGLTVSRGTFFSLGSMQFSDTGSATYNCNATFNKTATIKDLTLKENFVAQGDATIQGTLQADAELKAFGNEVSIGRNASNVTRLFVRTREPVLLEGDLSVNNRLYVSENLTVDGSLNIGPNSIPAAAIIGGIAGPTGLAGVTGAKGEIGNLGPTGAVGAVGATGAVGAVGATGAVGAVGATGAVGAVGATGAVGAVGATGAVGAVGATGAIGAVGATGAIGST